MKFSRSLVLKITYKCTSNIVPWYGTMVVPIVPSRQVMRIYMLVIL